MLLLDENLSPRLVVKLSNLFPGIQHVIDVGLGNDTDQRIWEYSKHNGLAIVSKDKDYVDFARRLGHPPKIIILKIGNSRSSVVDNYLQSNQNEIMKFLDDQTSGILTL